MPIMETGFANVPAFKAGRILACASVISVRSCKLLIDLFPSCLVASWKCRIPKQPRCNRYNSSKQQSSRNYRSLPLFVCNRLLLCRPEGESWWLCAEDISSTVLTPARLSMLCTDLPSACAARAGGCCSLADVDMICHCRRRSVCLPTRTEARDSALCMTRH